MSITTAGSSVASGTSHAVSAVGALSPAAGDLVVLVAVVNNDAGGRTISNWDTFTVIGTPNEASFSSLLGIGYRICTGSGDQPTLTISGSEAANYIAIRFPAGEWHGTTIPVISAFVENEGGSTSADPANLTPGTWDAAAEDTIWGVALGHYASTVSAYPTDFTANQTTQTTSAGSLAAVALRVLASASLNPGAWTLAASTANHTVTFAVRPAAPPAESYGVVVTALNDIQG